jgi:hypothetical protein
VQLGYGAYRCQVCQVTELRFPNFVPSPGFVDPAAESGRYVDFATTWAPTP